MKSFLISALTIATLNVFAQPAFAVNSFNCDAQMIGLNEDGVSKLGLIAPYLVSYSKDDLLNAQHSYESLALSFNPAKLSSERGAYIILDGRAKMMLLNVHVSLKTVNDQTVKVEMTDRLSNTLAVANFKTTAGKSTAVLSTNDGALHLTCQAK